MHDCCSVFAWALCLCWALQLGNVHGEPCLSNVFHMDLQVLSRTSQIFRDLPNWKCVLLCQRCLSTFFHLCHEGTSHVYGAVPLATRPHPNGHGRTIIPPRYAQHRRKRRDKFIWRVHLQSWAHHSQSSGGTRNGTG